jgi:uncharacterized protein (TIGR02145 family)
MAAQTVDATVLCGETYTINSTVDATGGTDIDVTYQWLENGSTITGASAASYTVPKTKSVGLYTYIRQAMTTACPDWQSSNAFTVEVKNKNEDGVCIRGLMWATRNVDTPGSFAASVCDPGKLYQFNRTKAWDNNTMPEALPPVSEDAEWHADSIVCPEGWRLPTSAEFSNMRSIYLANGNDRALTFYHDDSGEQCLVHMCCQWNINGKRQTATVPFFADPLKPDGSGSLISGNGYWSSTLTSGATYAIIMWPSANSFVFIPTVKQSALWIKCVQ